MKTQLFIWIIFLAQAIVPALTVAQSSDSLKIHYITYSNAGKIIKDTTTTVGHRDDIWNMRTFIIGTDTLQINGQLPCNCRIFIYQKENLIEDYVDLGGDSMYSEINQYTYNADGQRTSRNNKALNLPWLTTQYDYNERGKLKREFSKSSRYGDHSVEYIYDKEILLMKIINDNNHIDTLKINPR